MEVVCINKDLSGSFTIGKLYDVWNFWSDDVIRSDRSRPELNSAAVPDIGWRLVDDNGIVKWCREEDFLTIEQWREKKLEILLDTNMLK